MPNGHHLDQFDGNNRSKINDLTTIFTKFYALPVDWRRNWISSKEMTCFFIFNEHYCKWAWKYVKLDRNGTANCEGLLRNKQLLSSASCTSLALSFVINSLHSYLFSRFVPPQKRILFHWISYMCSLSFDFRRTNAEKIVRWNVDEQKEKLYL